MMREPLTKMVCDGMGYAPVTSHTSKEDHRCAMCGADLPAGTGLAAFKPGESFTNHADLRAPASKVTCGYCAALRAKPRLVATQKILVTPGKIYDLTSLEARSKVLMDPPEPPFQIVLSTVKAPQFQHMLWRTPHARSRDIFPVRVGTTLLQIERAEMLAVIESSRRLLALNAAANKRSKLKLPYHFDHALSDSEFGAPLPEIAALQGALADLAVLRRASRGALWAAGVVVMNSPAQTLTLISKEIDHVA